MRSTRLLTPSLATALLLGGSAAAAQQLPPSIAPYVTVRGPTIALTHARVIDGTGAAAREDQTVVISGERIVAVGPATSTTVPAGATVVDLTGRTLIPGLIGLHDHMYYSSSVTGSMIPMRVSYPKLFLANGVTTIRTTGSVDSYQELNLRARILKGELPGPEIVVTGPYLQGSGGGYSAMHALSGPDDARRMVSYWAEEGVTWFKAYTTISRAELEAAIDAAHQHGVKVTAHLCSVGFREAVELGIDNLEHGLLTDSEFFPGKQPDRCPSDYQAMVRTWAGLDLTRADVKETIALMVRNKVAMTSTLAVMELASPSRVPRDPRVLAALHPDVAADIERYYQQAATAKDSVDRAALARAMEFERAFVAEGGLLGAGSDPCCLSAIAGFADQRNFELLVEAGFPTETAVQIMSANGAKILGFDNRVGTITPGKAADLVVLEGDLTRDPGVIRRVSTVFRLGLGYDSAKLLDAVKGQVGVR
ncbi:MAG: amidohydrolase family protein [Gemmatimonadales bacterium]